MCTDLANFQMVEVIFSRALRNSCAKQIFSAKEWNQNIYDQLYNHTFDVKILTTDLTRNIFKMSSNGFFPVVF